MKWVKKDNIYVLVNDDFSSLLLHEEGYLDIMNMIKEDNCPSIFNFSKEKEKALMNVFLEIDLKYKNTGYEYLALVDAVTGEKLCDIVSSQLSDYVEPSKEMTKLLYRGGFESISMIHNHPLRTTFSTGDIIISNKLDSIKENIVINDNGESYYLYMPKCVKIKLETEEDIDNFSLYYEKKIDKIRQEGICMSFSDVKHRAMKEIAKEMGWKYGRKKVD